MRMNKLIALSVLLSFCLLGCDADELNKTASNINRTARDVAPDAAKGLFEDDLGKLSKRRGRSSGITGSIQSFYRDAERAVQSFFSDLFRNKNFSLRSRNKRQRHSPRRR